MIRVSSAKFVPRPGRDHGLGPEKRRRPCRRGAALSSTVILILGFANLVADGFFMGASNILARRSDVHNGSIPTLTNGRQSAGAGDVHHEGGNQLSGVSAAPARG